MPKIQSLRPRIGRFSTAIGSTMGQATYIYDQRRGNSTQRGYGYKWQKEREAWLSKNPLCVNCEQEGRINPASEVDHITPHRGNQKLFWDRKNWQSLCKTHHSEKTARGE